MKSIFIAFLLSISLCSAVLAAHVDGTCGVANGVASPTPPAIGNLCATGTPSSISQGGGQWLWVCFGNGPGGKKAASCSAPISTGPTLQLIVTPINPAIPSNAPAASAVAMLMGQWSDGSQFTGFFQFSSPNFSDGGLFAIAGNELVTNGPLTSLGNTMQSVTMVAVQ